MDILENSIINAADGCTDLSPDAEMHNIFESADNTAVEAEAVIESEVHIEEEQVRVNPPIPPGGRANMGRRRRRHRKDTET